jgi:hypothetical protein
MKVHNALAVLEKKRIEVNECFNSFPYFIGDTANDATSIGMTAENNVRELLPSDQINDVVNVRR